MDCNIYETGDFNQNSSNARAPEKEKIGVKVRKCEQLNLKLGK